MPFFINDDYLAAYDLRFLPISVDSIDTDKEQSIFVYVKGGDGGNLGKKSSESKYLLKSIDLSKELDGSSFADATDVFFDTKYLANLQNSTTTLNSVIQDAGYAIKYYTGQNVNESIVPITGSLRINFVPDQSFNLYTGYVVDGNSVNNGINAQEIKRIVVQPYENFAYYCQFSFDNSLNRITLSDIQKPDTTLVDTSFVKTGTNIYLSGSGVDFLGSCVITGVESNSLTGFPVGGTGSSFGPSSGHLYLLGNAGSIDNGTFYADSSTPAVLGADQYHSGNLFYLQIPSESYFKIPITGLKNAKYDNLLVFYVAELDYDDKDRKLDPVLNEVGAPYYNSYITGSTDFSYDFYYNNASSVGISSVEFGISLVDSENKTSNTEISSLFEDSNDEKNKSALKLKINRSSTRTAVGGGFKVNEVYNDLIFQRDSVGVQDVDGKNIFPEQLFTNNLKNRVFVRGGGENYVYSAYNNFEKTRIRDKNKFCILYHGFNIKTNTYFWGVNGSFNSRIGALSSDNLQKIDLVSNTNYLYIGNHCFANIFSDRDNLINSYPTSTFSQKNAAGDIFDAAKINLYETVAYLNIGQGGTNDEINKYISLIYQNLYAKYSKKIMFGGANYPFANVVNGYSEITSSSIYYDSDIVKTPLYGKISFASE
jgi:hypothetical protein